MKVHTIVQEVTSKTTNELLGYRPVRTFSNLRSATAYLDKLKLRAVPGARITYNVMATELHDSSEEEQQ